MADTYTTRGRFEKMNPGDYLDTWGDRRNNQVDLYDAAMDGVEALTVSGSVTLTTANGSSDQARKRALDCTGTGGTITVPNVEKNYLIRNATSGNVVVTTGSGTSATVKAGNVQWVLSTGSNACYIAQVNDFAAANIATTGTLASGALAVTGALSCTGNATLGDATSDVTTVNGQLIITKVVDVANTNAGIYVSNGNWMNFTASGGLAAPAVVGASGASRSTGTRIVLLQGSSTIADVGLGVATVTGTTFWLSVGDSGSYFRFYAGTTNVATIDGGGVASFVGSGTTTTASAANTFINSTTGQILRSTSAARFKTDIQPLEKEYADRWLDLTPVYYRSLCGVDNPEWGWYGFVADEAAEKGLPQLVHWGYPEDAFEIVEVEEEPAVTGKGKKKKVRRQFRTERRLKEGAQPTQPEGYQYERDGAFAQWHIKQLYERIAALEAKLA